MMESPPLVTRPHLLECHDCGAIQRVPAMPAGARATCPVCDAHLRHTRADPFTLPLALNFAALVMLAVGGFFTLLSVSTAGQRHSANLLTGPEELRTFGLWELSVVVLITTFAAPLVRTLCLTSVLASLRLRIQLPGARLAYAWVEHLRPWSMIEIFLLGVLVAYVRLSAIVHIDIGPAIVALGLLTLTVLAADILLDQSAVWEALDERQPRAPVHHPSAGLLGSAMHRMGCDTCRLVTRGRDGALCPRCGFALHHRKPNGVGRTCALLVAAIILYLPANLYPVLTVIRFGSGQPSTILGGVRELLSAGEWPLALLVFFASICVPVLKIVGLIVLLATTEAGSGKGLRDRIILYRIVDAVGRWSMIDIFMGSILVALVRFGAIVTITPGPGAVAFAAVVILTMFAARSFDPRLMWDRAA
jgi:paraquat-inducible protein A